MIRRSHVFGLVLLALAAPPCLADIYGFVDEHGVHLSDVALDSRYKLYMKTKPPVADKSVAPQASAETQPGLPPAAAAAMPKVHKPYAAMIAKVAREQKLEPALLHAVVMAESAYNPRARSHKGATGLMQLMPETAKRYGVSDRLNPLENLRGGARYLRDLLALFDNNLRLVLAAYNAGEGAVMRSGNAIPNYPETRAYVPRVLEHYERYRAHESAL